MAWIHALEIKTGLILMVTAGFGAQYLMWPVPFMFVVGGSRRLVYVAVAGAWFPAGLPAS
jgi:hypothetical protein